MAIIGHFTKKENGTFEGKMESFTLRVNVVLV
jgi:uncharacterized protein (DUF736 family)